jgi:hypothetical protein
MEGAYQSLGKLNVQFREGWEIVMSSVVYLTLPCDIVGLSGFLGEALKKISPYVDKYDSLLTEHSGKKYSHLVTDAIRLDRSYVLSYIRKLNTVNVALVTYGLLNGVELRTSSRSGRRRNDRVVPNTVVLVSNLLGGQSTSSSALLNYGVDSCGTLDTSSSVGCLVESESGPLGTSPSAGCLVESESEPLGTSPSAGCVANSEPEPLDTSSVDCVIDCEPERMVVSSTGVDIVVSANNNNDVNTATVTQQLSLAATSETSTIFSDSVDIRVPPEPTSADDS